MVSLNYVEDQLKTVGCNFKFFGRPEIRELRNILVQGEVIAQAVLGRYDNGTALLVVTNYRILLIDKKPMFLTLEDIRFDMVTEIDYSAQLLEGTIRIQTPNRVLRFTGWNHGRLRTVLNHVQQRVTDIRHHYIHQQFQQNRNEEATAPVVGSLAVQTHASGPINPYTLVPLTMRRRRVPKFY